MCGITGAIWTDPDKAIDAALLTQMTDVIAHRGPDDSGTYRSDFRLRPPYETMPGVALGHRRLSIIDLATGRQPLANEDDTIWVVFNGEIYNFPALRQRLEGSGHKFRTNTDTEVLVHLYEDEGTEMFRHLVGMFVLAIWDSRKRRLVIARDRLGQKPLVYRHDPGRLLLASELKSLLQAPDVPRELDPGAIDEYLTYQYVPHPNTIFKGVRKLPPAHYAVWQDDKLDVQCYWSPDFSHEVRRPREAELDELRELFDDAVRIRMRSDVPLGAFLSGGIDSSLVVAHMQKHSEQPVKTFSIGFTEKDYDESSYARLVANHLGTEHHELIVQPNALEVLPTLIWHYDEPFADSSSIPTYYVSKMTREHVTVSLSGDGGDELFAGYQRYKAVRLASWLDRLPYPLRRLGYARFWQRVPGGGNRKSFINRLKRVQLRLNLPPDRRYFGWMSVFREEERVRLYTDDFVSKLTDSDPFGFLQRAWSRSNGRDVVSAASAADLVTYLPCDLNTKVDIASMANSLECRQPFLDHRLAEFALTLPVRRKWRGVTGKRILRDAFGHMLPDEIWTRSKMGFGVPLEYWFRNELRDLLHDTLLGRSSIERGIFEKDEIGRLIDQHQNGTAEHSHRLWALLFFELWAQQWLDRVESSAAVTTSTAM